jgi:hypothetical protein
MTNPTDHGQIKLETTASPEYIDTSPPLGDHRLSIDQIVREAVLAERDACAHAVNSCPIKFYSAWTFEKALGEARRQIVGAIRARPSVPVTDTEPEATRKQVEEEIATWIRWLKDNYTEIEDLEPAAIAVAITSGDYRTGKAGG